MASVVLRKGGVVIIDGANEVTLSVLEADTIAKDIKILIGPAIRAYQIRDGLSQNMRSLPKAKST